MKETNWYDITQLAHKHMLLDDQHYGTRWVERIINFAMEVRQIEREACARVCDDFEMAGWALWDRTADPDAQGRATAAADCATAIRARGGAK